MTSINKNKTLKSVRKNARPACGIQIEKKKVNHHLDVECVRTKSKLIGEKTFFVLKSNNVEKKDFQTGCKIYEKIINPALINQDSENNSSFDSSLSATTHLNNNLVKKNLEVIVIDDDDHSYDSNKSSSNKKNTLITPGNKLSFLSDQWKSKLKDLAEKLSELSKDHIVFEEGCIYAWRKELNPFRLFGLNSHQNQNHIQLSDAIKNQVESDSIKIQNSSNEIFEKTYDFTNNLIEEDKHKMELIKSIDIKKFNASPPYYLQNFIYIIEKVFQSNDIFTLFELNDVKVLAKCRDLSQISLQLYVRLYLRKKGWFRCSKIQYPDIGADLNGSIDDLIKNEYLTDSKSLNNLDEILHLLSANEVRQLSKDFHLVKCGSTLSKKDLCSMLKKHCVQQKSLFKKNDSSLSLLMGKKAKEYLGPCVKLNEEVAFVFTRIFTLFSITTAHYEDVMYFTGYNEIYHLLQVNNCEVKYPSYTINKKTRLFTSSAELTSYVIAAENERELDMFMEKKDYDAAYGVYTKIKTRFISVCEELVNEEKRKVIRCFLLPYFLTCYSEPWILFRICGKSVEVLEKRQEYLEAVLLLELLLSQNYFGNCSRGGLWERLIIDTERYLKDLPKVVLLIKTALNDPFVRTGHRLSLLQRYQRLKNSPRCKKIVFEDSLLNDFLQFNEFREEILCAEIFLEGTSTQRTVFKNTSGEEQSMSHVEQFVLDHYKEKGFPNGLHGEGSVVTTLFILLFWDIVFMDVEDAFHSDFQCSPLDMYRDCFYSNRKDAIDKKLDWLQLSSDTELRNAIEISWDKHHGTNAVGVKWDMLQNAADAGDLALCLGSKLLSGVSELFCKDFRRRRGGFPDLVLWNIKTKSCKIIEVKGPGDKLSTKQLVWLNVLTSLGAEAVVCYVKGGGKRKRE